MEWFKINVVKINQEYKIKITGLNSTGQGVGRIEKFTVFIDGALPDEQVKVKITDIKSNYAIGDLIEIINASPDRVKPPCPVYNACGGCQLQHLSYTAQLKWKRQQVIDAVMRIGKIDVEVKNTLGMENPWRYRNKMQFPASRVKNKICIGCFARNSHNVIDIESCLIQRQENDLILQAARRVIEKFNLPIYNEDTHRGLIRHVMGRVGNSETMLVLVTASKNLPNEKSIVKALRNELPNITSIQQNVQSYHNNVILGRETKVLYGRNTIHDSIGNFNFNISARSFFQVNTIQTQVLYQKVLEFADLQGYETVVDAFCGTGTISLFLARRAKTVTGVEIVSSAIADAKVNARINNIRNAQFIIGDVAKIIPTIGINPDVVVLDPPRAGCEDKVLKSIAHFKPAKIVYVSCNPATLARDLAILETFNYKARVIQPVDMFPFTSHVESVTLLEAVKN